MKLTLEITILENYNPKLLELKRLIDGGNKCMFHIISINYVVTIDP
jgi:hypothetical protein